MRGNHLAYEATQAVRGGAGIETVDKCRDSILVSGQWTGVGTACRCRDSRQVLQQGQVSGQHTGVGSVHMCRYSGPISGQQTGADLECLSISCTADAALCQVHVLLCLTLAVLDTCCNCFIQ